MSATHGGKGDGRRPESQPGAYARGYDAIQWTKAPAGQECGGPKPEGGDNRRQPMIGEQKDGGATGATSPSRASGQFP